MEILQLAKLPLNVLRYAGHQMLGGAFGELGEKYGESMGGLEQRAPASIQFYRTPDPEITDNIRLGEE